MVPVEPQPLELHLDRGGGHAQGDSLRQLREAVPEPGAHPGLTLCAPTACAVGPAQANRRLLLAGLGRSLLPNPARAGGACSGALTSPAHLPLNRAAPCDLQVDTKIGIFCSGECQWSAHFARRDLRKW